MKAIPYFVNLFKWRLQVSSIFQSSPALFPLFLFLLLYFYFFSDNIFFFKMEERKSVFFFIILHFLFIFPNQNNEGNSHTVVQSVVPIDISSALLRFLNASISQYCQQSIHHPSNSSIWVYKDGYLMIANTIRTLLSGKFLISYLVR